MNEKTPKNRQMVHADDQFFFDSDLFFEVDGVSSATECTGLMPTPPADEAEAEAYTDLYAVPTPVQKENNQLQTAKKKTK